MVQHQTVTHINSKKNNSAVSDNLVTTKKKHYATDSGKTPETSYATTPKINNHLVFIKAQDRPPMSCIECITRDAPDRKGRRILLEENLIGSSNEFIFNSNIESSNSTFFLDRLRATPNSYFQSVELLQASIGNAVYTLKCEDDENNHSASPLSSFMSSIPSV